MQADNAGDAKRVNFVTFAQNLLGFDNRMAFVGIVDSQSRLLYSAFREGVKLNSEHRAMQEFMSLASQLTMDELGKTEPTLGSIGTALIRFAKRVFVLSRFNEYVIVVGLDAEVSTPLPDLITDFIKAAASSAPDLPSPLETVELSSSADS